jgi:hypothetical protein
VAKGNRFSSLPIAEKCARAPALSSVGSSRAAAVSSCFHARCAGVPGWRDMYTRLSSDEQSEVDAMKPPSTIILSDGVVLDYESAEKEIPLGLNEVCGYLPKGHPDAMTEGTADLAWIRGRIAYVADIKRSEWTTSDGPRSLQVKGYALAYCSKHSADVDGYVTGIWAATEGLWSWGELTMLDSDQCFEDWSRVRAAALHIDGDFSRGPHCRGCYGRARCPAYMVDPAGASDAITRYLTGELDMQRAAELLELTERMAETAKTAREILRGYADANGGVPDGDGKIWRQVRVAGRVSFDAATFEREHPEIAQQYMRTGAESMQHRWVNDPAFDEQRKQAARDKAKAKRLAAKEAL